MKKLSRFLMGGGLAVIAMGLVARLMLLEWITSILALLGVGVILIILAIVLDFRFFKELLGMKTTKNGLSLGAVVLMVGVLLITVNYISDVRNVKWDLTSNSANSLSDQSVSIVKALNEEVGFLGFFRPEANDQERMNKDSFETLVRMYQSESSKIKLFVHDPFKRRDLSEKYKVMSGDVVVTKGNLQTTVTDISEQAFTNAIVKLTRNTKNIYAITGHGERDLDDTEGRGVSQLKKYLEDEGYKVSNLNLAVNGKVPEDASAIMILGPTQDVAETELKVLKDYIQAGGRIFVAMDPMAKVHLIKLCQELGIEFQNFYIMDFLGRFLMRTAAVALGLQYSGNHEITSKIKKVQTIFPVAAPLRKSPNAPTEITVDALVMTEHNAVATTNNNEDALDPNSPKQQYTLAMASKGKIGTATKEFAGVVVGDSDFIANETIDVLGANRDLVLNILASLSNNAEMISIRPKTSQGSPLLLTTAEQGGLVAVVLGTLISLFGISLFTWYRRRGA